MGRVIGYIFDFREKGRTIDVKRRNERGKWEKKSLCHIFVKNSLLLGVSAMIDVKVILFWFVKYGNNQNEWLGCHFGGCVRQNCCRRQDTRPSVNLQDNLHNSMHSPVNITRPFYLIEA